MANIQQKFYLTPEGLAKLKKEHEESTVKKRPLAVERLARAREFGDLTENSEYFAAREDLMFMDDRIAELEHILKDVQLVKSPKNHDTVQLGSTIVVEVSGDMDEFTIVGKLEADPFRGKISNESPVGMALLGHQVGDEIIVSSSVKTTYKIKTIK
ncbi:MAG: transcription elongation factor GreA [bacterium]|nr:transcription elongation factor GreA [bacterium]